MQHCSSMSTVSFYACLMFYYSIIRASQAGYFLYKGLIFTSLLRVHRSARTSWMRGSRAPRINVPCEQVDEKDVGDVEYDKNSPISPLGTIRITEVVDVVDARGAAAVLTLRKGVRIAEVAGSSRQESSGIISAALV